MDLDNAITELVSTSGDRLLRVAYQLTHEPASAQDLVQEAIMKVWRSSRRRSSQPDDLYGYVRRAVLNEYLRTRRLRSGSIIVTDRVPEPTPGQGSIDRLIDRDEVWIMLGGLSARQRAVLVLRYYESLPDREIASVLGCREPTVRSLAMRGLATMRRRTVAIGGGGHHD